MRDGGVDLVRVFVEVDSGGCACSGAIDDPDSAGFRGVDVLTSGLVASYPGWIDVRRGSGKLGEIHRTGSESTENVASDAVASRPYLERIKP